MIGAGKYDQECTAARDSTGAAGIIMIVIGGRKGNGFSTQLPEPLAAIVPALLRDVANRIEESIKCQPPSQN